VENELQAPIREAVKAARILGIEVPEEYQNTRTANNSGSGAPRGKYIWEAENGKPFQGSVSDAMWRYSKGSGGSLGKNGERVLSVSEFWKTAGLSEEEVKPGERYEVTLPNDKKIAFQKVE